MSALSKLWDGPATYDLGLALLHFVWQGTAIALVAKVLLFLMRHRSAQLRYVTALVGLIIMVACPILTLGVLHRTSPKLQALHPTESEGPGGPSPESVFLAEHSSGTPLPDDFFDGAEGAAEHDPLRADWDDRNSAGATITPARSSSPMAFRLEPALRWLVLAWLAGVAVLSVRLLFSWSCVERLKRVKTQPTAEPEQTTFERLCARMRLRRAIRILISPSAQVPTAIGWLRPVVLLPAGMLLGLPPEQLEVVLAHELAHIRRHDYLVNLLQTVIETLLFYHPAVWWLSRRIRVERENACDDLALTVLGDRLVYAQALAATAELAHRQSGLAVAASDGDLLARIRRLSGVPQTTQTDSSAWISGVILVSLIGGIALATWWPQETRGKEAEPDNTLAVTEETAEDAQPLHVDPRMAAIITEVKKNEALYRNLETVVRRSKRLAVPENPKKWSFTAIDERLHVVVQRDLVYVRGEEVCTPLSGEQVRVEHVSAYDGEKTRSVEYGNSVNIHLERHESPHVYPPHTWALFHLRVNFPLSTFLQGTEAIRQDSKVHRYPRERGSVYEFPKVDTSLEGDEIVNGLKCVKIRCQRWYYSNSPPTTHLLWLAPEKNYLCVRTQTGDERKPSYRLESTVDEFREITPGVFLPARVSATDYEHESLRDGKAVPEWVDTFSLEEASLDTKRPSSFFGQIEIPRDLPLYTVKGGQLVDGGFEDRQSPSDAKDRLAEIIAQIRANEPLYSRLSMELEHAYQSFSRDITSQTNAIDIIRRDTREQSILDEANSWYAEQSTAVQSDGVNSEENTVQTFDDGWTRSLTSHTRVRMGERSTSMHAGLRKGGNQEIKVHRPHILLFRDAWQYQRLSEYLTSGWEDEHNGYTLGVAYLGEELRDGRPCAVLRLDVNVQPNKPVQTFRIVWLARDRNYLPIRFEWHQRDWSHSLPTAVQMVSDLRELRAGVWCPFRVTLLSHEKWAPVDLSIGRIVLQHRTDYRVVKAELGVEAKPDLFAGPLVPQGTKVQVQSETGQFLGQYEQPENGQLAISAEKYRELLNEANERQRKQQERDEALDKSIGQLVPGFPAAQWLNSQPLTWQDLSGKVVLLDFWAEWCGPCVTDIKRLGDVYRGLKDQEDPKIVIIGVHAAGSQQEAVEEAAKKHRMDYPICLDTPPSDGRSWGTLFGRFAVRAIPHAFVIGKDGTVVAHGSLDEMLSKAGELARD